MRLESYMGPIIEKVKKIMRWIINRLNKVQKNRAFFRHEKLTHSVDLLLYKRIRGIYYGEIRGNLR